MSFRYKKLETIEWREVPVLRNGITTYYLDEYEAFNDEDENLYKIFKDENLYKSFHTTKEEAMIIFDKIVNAKIKEQTVKLLSDIHSLWKEHKREDVEFDYAIFEKDVERILNAK